MTSFPILCVAAAAAASMAGGAQAAGAVRVSFVDPEQFIDVRDENRSAGRHLQTLQRIMVDAATPYVADGQTLKIEVLEVDLAGELRHGARPFEVRVLRGRADWPRIELRWTLEGAGQAARSGQAVVQDMTYLDRLPRALADTALVYERRMLGDWFRSEFAKAGVN